MLQLLKKYYLTISWIIVIIFLSFMPANNNQISRFSFPHADKFAHFFMYFLLSFLLLRDMNKNRINLHLVHYMLLSTILVLFGLITELIQHFFITSRYGDISDFIANAGGIIAGISFYFIVKKYIKRLKFNN
ncbi:MAG: VanZ family protein [Bacteroidota bacterium]